MASLLARLDGLPVIEGSIDRCKISRLAIIRMIFYGGAGSRQSATTCQSNRIFRENAASAFVKSRYIAEMSVLLMQISDMQKLTRTAPR